jgi:hypothetical protein
MKKAYLLYGLLLLSTGILAIICGPHSCEWGNGVYFASGLGGLLLAILLPFLQKDWPRKKRIGKGLLFLLGLIIFWCAGFLLGEFRLFCRMF